MIEICQQGGRLAPLAGDLLIRLDREISQYMEEVRHLQAAMVVLRETNATLARLLEDKDSEFRSETANKPYHPL